jgi:energy-converting hydrogenase Eha subunit H
MSLSQPVAEIKQLIIILCCVIFVEVVLVSKREETVGTNVDTQEDKESIIQKKNMIIMIVR